MNAPFTLTTRFGRHRATTAVTSLEDASRVFADLRDRHESPSSRADDGVVKELDGRTVAIVSYNGRVWGAEGWRPGASPLVEAIRSSSEGGT